MKAVKENFFAISLVTFIFLSLLLANNTFGKKSLLFSLVFIVYFSRKHFPIILSSSKNLFWMWMFQIWAALSCFWTFIFDKTFEIFTVQISFFILCLLSASYLIGKDLSVVFKRAIYILIIVLGVYLISHPSGILSSAGYQSIYPNKNHLGFTSAIGLLIVLFSSNKRIMDYFLMIFLFGLLILSKSKTSLALFLIILIATPLAFQLKIWIYRIKDVFIKSLVILASKGLYLLTYGLIFLGVIFREQISAFLVNSLRDDFITGRGEIWRTILMRSQPDLLIGIGPGVFWESGFKSEITQTFLYAKHPGWIENLVSADGGYIDIIGALGFIGLAMVFCIFLSSIKQAINLENNSNNKIALAMIFFAIGHNVTESDMYHSLNVVWFLIVFFSSYLAISTTARAKTNE